MATINKKTNKKGDFRFEIQFYINGKRKTICLNSQYSDKQAALIKRQVERLAECAATQRSPDAATSAWGDAIDDRLRGKLTDAGLTCGLVKATLGAVWHQFTSSPRFARMAPNTARNYLGARSRFFSFFDEGAAVEDVSKVDVEEWRESLVEGGFAEATIAGAIKCVRSAFNWAVDANLIQTHPFNSVFRGSFVNQSREFFIPRDWYRRLLEKCPDQDWRTIVALCRIGGLRCPSEVLAARWEDVDWEEGNFLVRDVKRKTTRIVPLFPELREELDKQFFASQETASPFVISKHRCAAKNFRKSFEKIVFWAGLQQWERLFHNLRGSRSCELFSAFPAHVAAAWLGQSEKVAADHYLHPTPEDFERARATETAVPTGKLLRSTRKHPAKSPSKIEIIKEE